MRPTSYGTCKGLCILRCDTRELRLGRSLAYNKIKTLDCKLLDVLIFTQASHLSILEWAVNQDSWIRLGGYSGHQFEELAQRF